MRCSVCNNEIQNNAKFCKYCGTAVQTRLIQKSKTPIGTKILIAVLTMIVLVLISVIGLFFLFEKGIIDNPWQEEVVVTEDGLTDSQGFNKDAQGESSNDMSGSQISVIDKDDMEESTGQADQQFDYTTNIEVEKQEYILPESDFRYIEKSELYGLTKEQCSIARNEIYARHGRKFNDENLQNYFNSLSWYEPTIEPEDFREEMLNSFEIANRDLIVEYEKECGYR